MEIKIDNVVSVYVGKPNMCMCGCAGTYTYSEKHRVYASNKRGYQVQDKEVNDKKVKRVVKKVMNTKEELEIIDGYIFTTVIGKTQYTVYCKEK